MRSERLEVGYREGNVVHLAARTIELEKEIKRVNQLGQIDYETLRQICELPTFPDQAS